MQFTLCIAQFTPVLGDFTANMDRHVALVSEARDRGADLVVFPELSLTGYHLRDLVGEVAVTADSGALEPLRELSRDVSLVAGFAEERRDHRFQIASGYFERGRLMHIHRKVYLPTYGMFDEDRYFTRGDRIQAFDSRFGRLGLLLCEDLWHASVPYLLALEGAEVLLCPSNSPARGVSGERLDTANIYDQLTRTFASLFGVFTVFANRVGYEEGVAFWGGSQVIGPGGELIAEAPQLEESLLFADLDLRAVRRARLATPLLGEERMDLTLHELERIRRERLEDQR